VPSTAYALVTPASATLWKVMLARVFAWYALKSRMVSYMANGDGVLGATLVKPVMVAVELPDGSYQSTH
jgi:hypothetical protein